MRIRANEFLISYLESMSKNGKYSQLLKNTGFMLMGTFGSRMVSIIMVPFYTLWLSVEDYGTSDIISVYATILTTIVSLGIGEALFVVPSQKTKDEKQSYFTTTICYIIVCVFVLSFLYLLVRLCCANIHNAFCENIIYICIMSLTSICGSCFSQFCKSIDKVKIFSLYGLIEGIIRAGLAFIIIPKFHLLGYIWTNIITGVLTSIYVFIAAKLWIYIKINTICIEKLKEMLAYSIPLIPNSLMWLIMTYINRPLMDRYLGVYVIGLYAFANKFPLIINSVFNNFSSAWQISVLEQYQKEGFADFFNRMLVIVVCGMSTLVVIIALISNNLIRLFINPEYFESIKYVPLLCLSSIYLSTSSVAGSVFLAVRRSKFYFYSSVLGVITVILLNFLLINKCGLDGVCWANIMSYFVTALARVIYANRFVKIRAILQLTLVSVITIIIVCAISYFDNYLIGYILCACLMIYFTRLCVKSPAIRAALVRKKH
jgi:O-antigen/teichoic acid export membrane protein